MKRVNLGVSLVASSLLACSGVEPTEPTPTPGSSAADTTAEAPAGQQLVGTFTLDVDAAGNGKLTMVDTRLATTVAVGATANRVNMINLSRGPCGPGLYCTNVRLQNLFAGNDLRGTTVVLNKITNTLGASASNADPLPSHLAGTTANGSLGVWVYGNLEEAGSLGDSIDRTWEFNWTSGTISVAGKVFADVRSAGAAVETSCTDGLDNDGDANFDCNDGDCATDAACPAEWCGTNGRDEDWDGDADCADDDCDGHPKCTEVVCDDGADSDGDGAYDCADSDCADDEACDDGGGGFIPTHTVGSFNLNDGPSWNENPPAYSCRQACAIVFGGDESQYRCSTSSTEFTGTAYYDGWGDTQYCVNAQPDDFRLDQGAGYDCGFEGCSFSAYIEDHGCSSVNHCWQ